MDQEKFDSRTTEEMQCPIRLVSTIMLHSNSDTYHFLAMIRLARVKSYEITAHTDQILGICPSRQVKVVPLNNLHTVVPLLWHFSVFLTEIIYSLTIIDTILTGQSF